MTDKELIAEFCKRYFLSENKEEFKKQVISYGFFSSRLYWCDAWELNQPECPELDWSDEGKEGYELEQHSREYDWTSISEELTEDLSNLTGHSVDATIDYSA